MMVESSATNAAHSGPTRKHALHPPLRVRLGLCLLLVLGACTPPAEDTGAQADDGAGATTEDEPLDFSDICTGACTSSDVLDPAILDACGCD